MKRFDKKRFSMKQVTFLLSLVIIGAAVFAYASTVTIPNTFSTNTTISSSQMNANFTAVKTAVDDNDSRISQNTTALPLISTVEGSGIGLPATYTDVLTITVNAPGAGFVLVTANGFIQLSSHTTSGYSSVYVGLSDVSNTGPLAGNYTRFYLSATVSAGSFEIPYSVHAVFPVSQGTNTFYLVGQENGQTGSGTLYSNRLTAMFVKFGF